jgi:hypothetical protein
MRNCESESEGAWEQEGAYRRERSLPFGALVGPLTNKNEEVMKLFVGQGTNKG